MKEEKLIMPTDVVEVTGTGTSFLKEGEKITIHKLQADKLVAKGAAVIGELPKKDKK